MMGTVSTCRDIGKPDKLAKGILGVPDQTKHREPKLSSSHIIKTVCCQKIYRRMKLLSNGTYKWPSEDLTCMLIVSSTSPKVANLLGLYVTTLEIRAWERRSRNLKNRKRNVKACSTNARWYERW